MLAETAAAVGSIKAAFDIAKGIQTVQTSTEVKQAVGEMLDKLISARMQAVEAAEKERGLTEEIERLNAEIARLNDWSAEAARYELAEVGDGTFAYRLAGEMPTEGPARWLCPNCFEDRVKSLMQTEKITTGRVEMLNCHRCDLNILVRGSRTELPSRTATRR